VALVSAVPWFGWRSVVPVVVSVAIATAINLVLLPRMARPEYPMALSVVVVLVGSALGLLLAHPPPLFALPFLAILPFMTAAAMPAPGATALSLLSGGVMTAMAFLMGAQQVLHNPSILVLPLALLGAISLIGHGIGQATIDHLAVATIDPLTGVFNRGALQARVTELSYRAAPRSGQGPTAREPVAVLIADLDGFKAINDEHGHAAGDSVLAEVAQRIRVGLRLFDSVYRIGGEEFLVLLVGMDEHEAAAVGERIRVSLRRRRIAGLAVTASVGVAACAPGEPFDYDRLFAAADAALRAAKAAGRDRVVTGSAPPAPAGVAA
jgi:diguanylate cyclase (GGDEF)-like protein